jgi:hypothetical protein
VAGASKLHSWQQHQTLPAACEGTSLNLRGSPAPSLGVESRDPTTAGDMVFLISNDGRGVDGNGGVELGPINVESAIVIGVLWGGLPLNRTEVVRGVLGSGLNVGCIGSSISLPVRQACLHIVLTYFPQTAFI